MILFPPKFTVVLGLTVSVLLMVAPPFSVVVPVTVVLPATVVLPPTVKLFLTFTLSARPNFTCCELAALLLVSTMLLSAADDRSTESPGLTAAPFAPFAVRFQPCPT
ncbi:hypothetical protein CDEF62S_00860 [Castellaniella defragrans]